MVRPVSLRPAHTSALAGSSAPDTVAGPVTIPGKEKGGFKLDLPPDSDRYQIIIALTFHTILLRNKLDVSSGSFYSYITVWIML